MNKSTTEKTVIPTLNEMITQRDYWIGQYAQVVAQNNELLAALKDCLDALKNETVRYGHSSVAIFSAERKAETLIARLSTKAGKASTQPTLAERK